MRVVDKIDDSFNTGKRVIYVVELKSNIFVDVMVINDDIHGENYSYIMDFDGGQTYIKTENGDRGMIFRFDENEVLAFVDKQISVNQ